jgi:IS30 family transposase
MDFIEQLPPLSDYSMILVIVDRLTKQALFLPTTDNVMSEEVMQLYFKNVFSQHGVPMHITSDCGPGFVSHFFCSLSTLLGICLHFTSGYHPQADGQTECVNQMLKQYLHIHCNYQQDDWSNWLPIAEFTYNNAVRFSHVVH